MELPRKISKEVEDISIEEWAKNNFEAISALLEMHRRRLVKTKSRFHDFYDSSTRSLSEMTLCRASERICNKLTAPTGYKAEWGIVRLNPSNNTDLENKMFGIDHQFIVGEGKIVDFTVGQFGKSTGTPNQVLERFKKRAPGLVTIYPNGLGVVIGDAETIKIQLGINYHIGKKELAYRVGPFDIFRRN